MNAWQVALQLKYLLQNVQWAGGSGTLVFGDRGVAVFSGIPDENHVPVQSHWCLVSVDSGTADESDPDVWEQNYTLIIGAQVVGDRLGEQALTGGPSATLVHSKGRGVLELTDRVLSAVGDLSALNGIQIHTSAASLTSPIYLQDNRHLALQTIGLDAICTSQRYYSPPQQIAYDANDQQFTWTGTQCSSRWDFLQYRLVKKSGSSASLYPQDGTTLYRGMNAYYDVAAVGGNTYTVFAEYDSRGRNTPEDASEPETGAYLVVN